MRSTTARKRPAHCRAISAVTLPSFWGSAAVASLQTLWAVGNALAHPL